MNKPNQPDSQNKSVSDILKKIEQKAKNSRRIYRGESECYCRVSSGLYRSYAQKQKIRNPAKVFRRMQDIISKRAEEYLNDNTDFNILAQIQHFGGKTNLIDFTTDYLIALFFACDRAHDKDGRVILLKRESTADYTVTEMPTIINRAASQKSVLVEPTNGFIDPGHYEKVEIPHNLKRNILIHLQKFHGISTKRVYDDIHGYIQSMEWDKSSYEAWIRGREYEDSGEYQKAIKAYTSAIGQKLDFFEGYNDRGHLHYKAGNFGQALKDYNTAIELNPDNANSYYNRGRFYFDRDDYEEALEDYNIAIVLCPDDNVDIVDYYHARGFLYFQTDEFALALEDYTTAIRLKPDNHRLYLDRGMLYLKNEEESLAIRDFSEWISRSDEEDIEVLLNRLEKYAPQYGIELPEHIKSRLKTTVAQNLSLCSSCRSDLPIATFLTPRGFTFL